MSALALAAALLVSPTFAWAGPDGGCTCRYKGGDVAEGDTICMKTANGSEMAMCDRVLNNTSWKFLGVPCPSAAVDATPLQNPA